MASENEDSEYTSGEAKNPIRYNPKDRSKPHNAGDGANYSLSNLYASAPSISQELLDAAMTEKTGIEEQCRIDSTVLRDDLRGGGVQDPQTLLQTAQGIDFGEIGLR